MFILSINYVLIKRRRCEAYPRKTNHKLQYLIPNRLNNPYRTPNEWDLPESHSIVLHRSIDVSQVLLKISEIIMDFGIMWYAGQPRPKLAIKHYFQSCPLS